LSYYLLQVEKMKIVLSDNGLHLRFAPLTLTRPVGNLRMGILTNDERWKQFVPNAEIFYETESYLQNKFQGTDKWDIKINANVIPNQELVDQIQLLKKNTRLVINGICIAEKGNAIKDEVEFNGEAPLILDQRWDLYQQNGKVLTADFELITQGRKSQALSTSNTIIGDASLVFLEEGASVEACILNTKSGPIYVGKNAEVMEGSVVRGPLALCESAGLKLGTKVYGPTTLGPHCKVGGEVNNVIFQAFSNKGHDGFIGNAVIGEWCNLGADTNSSNLKNNYSNVKAYSYETDQMENTDVQFMGLMMGDHSKCGINTMFNTATVVGVSANIYGGDFPSKKIDSFSWGGPNHRVVDFQLEKAIEAAKAMMERRNVPFTEADREIFEFLSQHNR
jgi:UDP-N-acetylglucosamine diphosphorylase/glucosamine-1-phosphate N-acetyltransferase